MVELCEGTCCAMKGDFPQIRREGDDVSAISRWKGLKCSGVATEHYLYRTMGNIYICIKFELLGVKVPSIFLGTVGFSPPREGR